VEARGGLRDDGRLGGWVAERGWCSGGAMVAAVITVVALSACHASLGGGRLRRQSGLRRARGGGPCVVAAKAAFHLGRRARDQRADAGLSTLPPLVGN